MQIAETVNCTTMAALLHLQLTIAPTCCLPSDLRKPLHVSFTNLEGLAEAGIDGGGLFREFLSQLLQIGFDPNRGFFKANHEGLLHPNPQVSLQWSTWCVSVLPGKVTPVTVVVILSYIHSGYPHTMDNISYSL